MPSVYHAWPIITVSDITSTHCTVGGPALASWASRPNLATCANRAVLWPTTHTAGRHLLSVIQAATNTDHL